jgi:hypothetical protein
MKAIYKKITAFALTLLVFLSTVSFTVEQHFCGDVLVDYSFDGSAKSCSMDIGQADDNARECSFLQTQDCCSNETLSITGQDELKISFNNFSFEQQLFIVSYVYTYLVSYEGLDQKVVPFEHYPPPTLIRDILVLEQTFLI